MTTLLIGIGAGVTLGFVVTGLLRGLSCSSAFDDGYRMGLEAGQGCDQTVHRPRWLVQPPDGNWCETSEAFARSVECDGWRVAMVEDDMEVR